MTICRMSSFVQARGKAFYLGDEEIRFAGLGVGSWLNLEHFMLGIPTPDKQIRQVFQDVYGTDISGRFFREFTDAFLAEEDFLLLKHAGINMIRVPFNYRLFIDDQQPEVLLEEGFRCFERLLDLCEKHHIFLLPDLHAVPGGQNPDWHADNDTGIPEFWLYKVFRDQIVRLWGSIAARFRDREYLLGYDLLNEPFLIPPQAGLLDSFYREVIAEIRKVDPHHLIFLEGDGFAMDFSALGRFDGPQIALTFHCYPTVWEEELLDPALPRSERIDRFGRVIERLVSIRDIFGMPVLCGEAGYEIDRQNPAFALELLEDTLALFDKHKVSWTIWCYKDAHFMGLTYPKEDTAWMRFIEKLEPLWSHHREMDMANAMMEDIGTRHFGGINSEQRYILQFRLRGILYSLQRERILKPLLESYPAEEILELPRSFALRNCWYHEEYLALLRRSSEQLQND